MFTCRVCRRGQLPASRAARAKSGDPVCANCWANYPEKRVVDVLDAERNLPAKRKTNPREPDEVIDPTQFARELTCNVGASARFAFRRSVQDNTGKLRDSAKRYADHLDEWPAFTREVFAHLYDPDELTPLPQDDQSAFARQAIHALEQQPSFPMLRSAASAHRTIAAEAGAKMADIVGKALGLDKLQPDEVESADPRSSQDTIDAVNEMMQDAGASTEQVSEALEEAGREAVKANSHRASMMANLEQAMQTRGMAKLIEAVTAEAQQKAEAVGMMRGFGLNGDAESGDDGIDDELLKFVLGNPDLLRVLKECGRLRDAAAAKGMSTTATGACDVVGVRPDDDPTRLLPEELVMLDDEDLGDATLARLLDGETLCWEMEGEEFRDRGDIVLVVDRSGSMGGTTIIFARALAAACLMNARLQGRRVVLCMFSSGAPTVVNVQGIHGLKDAIRALGLPASGGTDTSGAFRAVHEHGLADLRDPDVLLITDGVFPDNGELRSQLKRFPDDTRFNGLMLNYSWQQGQHSWLDEQWEVSADGSPSNNDALLKIMSTVGSKNAKRKDKAA